MEVRSLTVVRNKGLTNVCNLLLCAQKHNFVLGRVAMVSSAFSTGEVSADSGDCLIEFIGKSNDKSIDFFGAAEKLGPLYETMKCSATVIAVSRVAVANLIDLVPFIFK